MVYCSYNFMLKKFKRIWNAYHEGRLEEAEKIQHEACRIIDALLQVWRAANPAGKYGNGSEAAPPGL